MIPQIGNLILAFSSGLAILLMLIPVSGVLNNNQKLKNFTRPLVYLLFFSITAAEVLLVICLLNNDFSVRYVAANSNADLPFYYQIAAAWGAHEGSLLLWSFLLAGWTAAIAIQRSKINEDAVQCVLAVMGFVNLGFLLFITLTSNPFATIFPAPLDGRDLNPLLQDIGLIFHPPLLYMGYVGFSVAFAFAIAALIIGRFDTEWINWFRPWVLVAWLFLSMGILLGSIWAYRELGWGGWWFWDPVENSSLMPWITGTALLHSVLMARKQGTFKIWTLLLAITTFSLCLIGTFLVRSGILVSVHAFSSDPGRGILILVFLVLVIGGSFLLFALRGAKIISQTPPTALFSKDSFMLAGNVLLLTAMLIVFVGTLYPLVHKMLGYGSISVGKPFFDSMFYWLMIPFALVMGITPIMKWQDDKFSRLVAVTAVIAVISAIFAFILGYIIPSTTYVEVVVSLFMVSWITLFLLYSLYKPGKSLWANLCSMSAGRWGMFAAHLGVAMMIFGVSISHYYAQERTEHMQLGQTTSIGEYQFTFQKISMVQGPNYQGARGTFGVTNDGKEIATLLPERRIYTTSRMPMTEAAIDSTMTRDLYAALSERLEDGSWVIRLYYKPFIFWIWLGGLMIILGGFVAIFDRSFLRPKHQNTQTA